jgi:ROK family
VFRGADTLRRTLTPIGPDQLRRERRGGGREKVRAARGLTNYVYLHLGSGVGLGLALGARLYRGRGAAGEIGFLLLGDGRDGGARGRVHRPYVGVLG